MTNIWSKLSRRSQEGSASIPGLLYSPLVKNIFRQNFIIFARNIFHHFETCRRPFSTLWLPQGVILHGTQLIYVRYRPFNLNAVTVTTASCTSISGGNLVDGLPPAYSMTLWGSHSVENALRQVSKWWKIFRAKIIKFIRKIFFTRGLYNSLGTFSGPSRDLTDSFYVLLA